MKLHSDVIDRWSQVYAALYAAQVAGNVARDVQLTVLSPIGSRTRKHAWEVRLSTADKTSGPKRTRYRTNSGTRGASDGGGGNWVDLNYAATYHEWGFFIAEIFRVDPDAVFGPYRGVDDFNHKTHDAYRPACPTVGV